MVHRAFAVCSFLVVGVAAQAPLPLPASHATVEASSATNVPFGRSTPTRVQYVYDASLFAGPTTVTGVQFRLDGGQVAVAKVVDVEISMSTMPNDLVDLDPDFSLNRGADEAIVLPRQLLTLPAQGAGATPNPFLPQIPLTTPFVYDPQLGGLVLEVTVYGQPPGTYLLDATYLCNSPMVSVGPASCVGSTSLPLLAESATTQVLWGKPWIVRVADGQPGALLLLALGTQEGGVWNGLVLPQELSAIGASGCYLSIDTAIVYSAIAQVDGSAQFPFFIPNTPLALGYWLRFQGAAFDPQANALGLITSQAQKVQVCGWEPVGRVWSSGVTTQYGNREIGLGAVIQLVTQ
ncbi:MAG: hypothetical protein H6835_05575 [Planctomycetes bacterium]|nr:hypothetical protein [Planctomycetota bacterium]